MSSPHGSTVPAGGRDRAVAVSAESTGEDGHIAKATLQRFIKDIRHLVLEVLGGDERVQKLLTTVKHRMNFTSTATQIAVIVEGFPKVEDRFVSRFCASINKDTNFWVELPSHSVEEPAVGVDLLLVFSLDDEDDLDGNEIVGIVLLGQNELGCGVDGKLSGILKDVGDGILAIHLLLHDTILVDANRSQDIQNTLVHLVEPVHNEGDGDLLPVRKTLFCITAPEGGLACLADVTDVHHDTMQRASIKRLVFVIRRHRDQDLRLAVVEFCPQRPTILFRKVVGVTCACRVSHMREFCCRVRRVLGLNRVLNGSRDGIFGNEVAFRELDPANDTPLERLTLAPSPSGVK